MKEQEALRQAERNRLIAEAVIDLARELAGERVLRHLGEQAMQLL